MTDRLKLHQVDTAGASAGDVPTYNPATDSYEPGPGGATAGTYVEADGLVTLSSHDAAPAGPPAVGDLWYDPDDYATAAAAVVTVDDSGFTHVTGTNVQDALASVDSQLGVGGTPTVALVPLTTEVGGVPDFVWDDDNQLVMTEVPL